MSLARGLGFSVGSTGAQGPAGSTGAVGATGPAGSASTVSQTQSATGYTLALADKDFLTYATGASMRLNIALFATVAYPVDAEYHFCQFGAGQIGVTYAAGVTIVCGDAFKSATLGAVFTLKNKSTNLWIMFGNITV